MLLTLLLKRLGQMALVVWTIGTITFFITLLLPGNMAYRIAASRYGYDQVDTAAAQAVASQLQLDQPWYWRYLSWFGDLLEFNLGKSLVSERPVWVEISHQFGHTFSLALLALVFSLFIGFPLGLLAALKPNSWFDKLTWGLSIGLRSLPAFILGIALMTLFALELNWLPAAGYGSWEHYLLPALTLAVALSAVAMRIVRNSALQVKQSSYYHFGRLKGLTPWRNFSHHGLRNLAVPVLSFYSVQLVYLIEGIVVVESLFAWPGIGHAIVHAVMARDVPMIQGTALLMGIMFVILNLLVDLLNNYLDPRGRKVKEAVNV
ncbi:ABC transporter permease [Psittacicella gerlachiana]|uniref:ABC transporter permease n=1 Tax=Psittacicella gerlachiana TaxID=2028574 RepID=A0A3A1YH67_9GAMM|nr:ABC transporter permease [Psittacicella gerlachiana]RIY37492.1 ABC transporter permease [Psittacicella gerlachiana]